MDCRNCTSQVTEQSLFCTHCGEKIPFRRLTIKSIIKTAFSQFFDIDNKLFRTFIKLFKQPQIVIEDYINGFRKKYINAIAYLGIAITLLGLQFFILKKFYPELLSINMEQHDEKTVFVEKFFDIFYNYQGLITIAYLPINALASRFVFIDSKKYNLAEHFIINTYPAAHMTIVWFFVVIATLPFGVNFNTLSQFIAIPMLIYMVFVFKRLYRFSWFSTILRVIAYFLLSYVILMIILYILAIILGNYLGFANQILSNTA